MHGTSSFVATHAPGAGPLMIMPASVDHCEQIARIHEQSLNLGFTSTLGTEALRRLYAAMVDHPGTDVFVCMHRDEVVGFVAVTASAGGLYKWILRHRLFSVGRFLLPRLFGPRRILHMLETLLMPSSTALECLPSAELISVAVRPELRGLNAGRRLIQAGLNALADRGIDAVRLSCSSLLESNKFYQRIGFELAAVKDHHGHPVNVYTRRLSPVTEPAPMPMAAPGLAVAAT